MGSTDTKSRGKTPSVLHNKNFASYWIATFAYYAGMFMENTAYGWLVYTITKSAFLLGLATTISTLGDFLNIPGGFIADRMKKKNMLYISQAALGVNAIITAVLLSAGIVEYQYIVLLSFTHILAQQFAMPARLAFVSEIVSKEEFMSAYSLYYVALNTMTVAAPTIAGLLTSIIGVAGVYFVIGACHLVFFVPFQATHVLGTAKARPESSMRKDFVELLRFARRNTTLLTLIILGCCLTLFGQSVTVLNPVFAVDILNVGAVGLGLLGSAQGIGSLVGSIFLASISHSKRKTLVLLGSGVLRGLSLLLFASSGTFYLSMFFMALGGAASGVHMVARSTLFQLCATDDMRGRITMLYMMTSELRPIGTLLIGIIAQNMGAPLAVGMFSLLWIVSCVAVAVLRPSFRRLELE